MEGIVAGDDAHAVFAEARHQVVQQGQPGGEGAMETLLLVGDGLEDEVALLGQVGIMAAHLVDDDIGDLRQEGGIKTKQLAKTGRTTQNHTQHIAAAFVAGQDAVADQKGDGPAVVGDGAVVREIGLTVGVVFLQQLLDARHDGREGVGVVIVVRALEDTRQTFQARAGIDAGPGQRDEFAAGFLVVLHKDQVPDFQVFVVLVDAAGLLLAQVAPIVVDLGTRATGAGVAHRPPVVFFAKAEDAVGRRARLDPQPLGFVVFRIHGEPEAVQRQLQFVDEQVPGKGDGVALEIIAKGEVAQHLEKSMMAGAGADVFQVVVFAADAHALLAGHGTRVGTFFQTEEKVFELHHSGIGQQQGRVVAGDQAATVHDGMAFGLEIVEKVLANLIGR